LGWSNFDEIIEENLKVGLFSRLRRDAKIGFTQAQAKGKELLYRNLLVEVGIECTIGVGKPAAAEMVDDFVFQDLGIPGQQRHRTTSWRVLI
jgi:hypothetical protein